MSPFDLTETRTRTKVFVSGTMIERGSEDLIDASQKPQSPPPCTPTRRRRGPNTRSSRRRRQCTRTDCRFDAFGTPVAFDRLPWISAMEHSPDQLNTWDMADLSQLSAEGAHDEDSETSGPGPVRRRKTSLRTNPLGSGPESSSEDAPLRLRLPTLALDQLSSNPHTPVSQTFNHSEITFHDLLPVFPSQSHNDA